MEGMAKERSKPFVVTGFRPWQRFPAEGRRYSQALHKGWVGVASGHSGGSPQPWGSILLDLSHKSFWHTQLNVLPHLVTKDVWCGMRQACGAMKRLASAAVLRRGHARRVLALVLRRPRFRAGSMAREVRSLPSVHLQHANFTASVQDPNHS